MKKLLPILPLLALGAASRGAPDEPTFLRFDRDNLIVEHSVSDGEAVVRLSVDSDQTLERLELRSPAGNTIFVVHGGGALGRAISQCKVESEKTDLASLRQQFPAGEYELRARTTSGQLLRGTPVLEHELPRTPVLIYPFDGALQVPTAGLVLQWFDDPEVAGYEIQLEQDDNDGLQVRLPGGSNRFEVPDGLLEAGKDAQLELAARAPNGNLVLTEIHFTTR